MKHFMIRNTLLIFTLSLIAFPPTASANPATEKNEALSLLHIPIAEARTEKPVLIEADILGDWSLEHAVVMVRPLSEEESVRTRRFNKGCQKHPDGAPTPEGWCAIELLRREEFYAVELPAEMIQPPGLHYYIETTDNLGVTTLRFASPDAPQHLRVSGSSEATEREEKLLRHDGMTSRFELSGELSLHGRELIYGWNDQRGNFESETDNFSDIVGLGEFSYTYRLLGFLYAMKFGVSVMRAQRPRVDGEKIIEGSEPGFNWGYGQLDFEFHELVSASTRLILGASQEGFIAGVGGEMRLGRSYGTHFAAHFDIITDIGSEIGMAFRWTTIPRFPMGIHIELNSFPEGEEGRRSTRLFYDAAWEINPNFDLGLSLGYASRNENLSGGAFFGLRTGYEF